MAQYNARGVVLDYQLSGSVSSFTFTNGATYCISNWFIVGLGGATLQPGTCVKFATNASLELTGPVTTPSTNNPAVLTSVDDNAYGDRIQNSTAEPKYAARPALQMSYNDRGQMAPQNLLVRWAQIGVDWEEDAGYNGTMSSSAFQDCQTALLVDMYNDTLYLSNDTYCNVVTPVSLQYGTLSGSMTANCGTATNLALVDASHRYGVEGEPSITVNPANPSELFVVANHTTNNTDFPSLFTARSTDGGTNWTTNALVNTTGIYDPSAAFDAFGNLFVSYILNSGEQVVVDLSTDGGSSFSTITNFSGATGYFDQPHTATGPSGSPGTSSVWVTFRDVNYPYYGIVAAGATVTNLGHVSPWTSPAQIGNSAGYNWGDIVVGPTGQVAVVFEYAASNGPTNTDILMSVNPSGVGGTFPGAWKVLTSNAGHGQVIPASPSRGIDVVPGLAWDRTGGQYRGRLYMVYTDSPLNQTTNLDIYVVYSDANGATNTWSSPLKIDGGATNSCHFLPRVALDQTSGKVAVSWYDCRADTNNVKTQFYAAVSSDGGHSFPSNLPLESGHSDATITNFPRQWDYFDYTGLAYYGGYFYPAWADNSNNPASNPDGTGAMDIFVGKVQY